MAPLVSQGIVEGLLQPRAYHQLQCYESALTWAHTEGAITAPETSHAVACAIEEAEKAKEEGKEKVILFNYSGHGLMDLTGYESYLSGHLSDFSLPDEELDKYQAVLKDLPKPEAKKSGKW